MEDIAEREDLHTAEEYDDAASSLSKELLMAKQMHQGPKQAFQTPQTDKSAKLNINNSIGKQSMIDSDVDGLLKWAKDLPDDISVGPGQSFYGGMMNRTLNKQSPQR